MLVSVCLCLFAYVCLLVSPCLCLHACVYRLVIAEMKQGCKWCTLWRGTQATQGVFVLSEHHTVTRYTLKYNFTTLVEN
jgi:hypothetical protein